MKVINGINEVPTTTTTWLLLYDAVSTGGNKLKQPRRTRKHKKSKREIERTCARITVELGDDCVHRENIMF